MPFKKGDMVLVIGIDDDANKDWPRPGAIGEIHWICVCMVMKFTEAYQVRFPSNRSGCYRRSQLRKLEPPGADETTEAERKVTA